MGLQAAAHEERPLACHVGGALAAVEASIPLIASLIIFEQRRH